jgi:hypothetical protein
MVGVVLGTILDAKVIHHQTESDVASVMLKEAGSVRALGVAMRLKMRAETKLA